MMDVALQDPEVLPSGWQTLYISLTYIKFNLHLDGFPGPQLGQMHQKQPSTTSLLIGLIYHYRVYYAKMMLVRVQNVENNVMKSHYMQPNGYEAENDIIFNIFKMSQY